MKHRTRLLSSSFRIASFTALLCVFCARLTAAEAPKPNLIFILADDIAQGDLGCYGQKRIETPHLDRMAAEGARYTQAYAGTSVTATASRGPLHPACSAILSS